MIAWLSGWKSYALALVVGALLIAGARIWLAADRHEQYQRGYDTATSDQMIETARIIASNREAEQRKQREADDRYAEIQKELRAALASRDIAKSSADSLRDDIETQRALAAENAKRAGRNVAKAESSWLLLESCRREYAQLVDHVEELNGAFRTVQAWASVADSDGAKRYGYGVE